ncbi:efflux RND transporter periplasmic adaptor subunit [Pseudovibrio sp. JE062]|uniref:efflux RND transporter periplasmic adaptor subunit n=1 Tax=Pseudovibrio sp. JE062 TaxID=439495 RepID=UPI000186B8A1|nr:efflux RND transporter periplasmic adaptor subunit [Pseudovibrio sp. JE062]EEA92350.1 copper/silver resistance periplasmic protein [Pseudovibrio sp. JE062]
MRSKYAVVVGFAVVASVSAGLGIFLGSSVDWTSGSSGGTDKEILYWVAPMDPNFRRDEPGKSPMGMDLIPVYAGEETQPNGTGVTLSPSVINTIGVRTAIASVEPISQKIESVGFVGYDEHRSSQVHLRTEGWIQKLNIRAVGDPVEKGDLLFTVYAPEVTVASADLIRAVRGGDRAAEQNIRIQLQNYGIDTAQIDQMARASKPADVFKVFAPQSGVVTTLEAADGMYLQPDSIALTLADLSSVWLMVDVFEQDIARLSPNSEVLASFEHLPGKVLDGRIDYIYPELDSVTRTLPVRLHFDNSKGFLRPNMFGRVTIIPSETRNAITIPTSALIRTGMSERVILQTEEGTFQPRIVTPGLTGSFGEGSRTEILQGLQAGDEVVTSAQFLIDSESSLSAGMERMSPAQGAPIWSEGTVTRVDPEANAITIRHAVIKELDWPEMETTFAVRGNLDEFDVSASKQVEFAITRDSDKRFSLVEMHESGEKLSKSAPAEPVGADDK